MGRHTRHGIQKCNSDSHTSVLWPIGLSGLGFDLHSVCWRGQWLAFLCSRSQIESSVCGGERGRGRGEGEGGRGEEREEGGRENGEVVEVEDTKTNDETIP